MIAQQLRSNFGGSSRVKFCGFDWAHDVRGGTLLSHADGRSERKQPVLRTFQCESRRAPAIFGRTLFSLFRCSVGLTSLLLTQGLSALWQLLHCLRRREWCGSTRLVLAANGQSPA